MIGYSDFNPDPPRPLPSPQRPERRDRGLGLGLDAGNLLTKLGLDDSECNYLVMFFILGVFALAVSDFMKKK